MSVEPGPRWADEDEVVLLASDGSAVGTSTKQETHHASTPLHLAFSCYVFDHSDRLLVTRRSFEKLVFPGERTNSCCGHPRPGEQLTAAVTRRLGSELGLDVAEGELRLILPEFSYRAESLGIWENELCPVYVATVPTGTPVHPDANEVDAAWWEPWEDYVERAQTQPETISPWSVTQVRELVSLGSSPAAWPAASGDRLPLAARF